MVPEVLAFSIVILLFSIIVHEVAHGLAALYFGDDTADRAGRLTLNPIPHIDPIGSILVPGILLLPTILYGVPPSFFIAWAKPVPVNPLHFDNIRLGEFVVSLAGIISNIALATIAAILFHLFGDNFYPLLPNILSYAVQINLVLAFFNLLPIPPLDGSKIVASLLPPHLEYQFRKLEQYGFLILFFILWSPLGNILWVFIRFFVNLFRGILGV
jgi:Zn-dependent protease